MNKTSTIKNYKRGDGEELMEKVSGRKLNFDRRWGDVYIESPASIFFLIPSSTERRRQKDDRVEISLTSEGKEENNHHKI